MSSQVTEPKRETEFEVQAYVWSELRKLGINARGEVKTTFPAERRAVCRFDIAIFENGLLVGIIEIKTAIIKHKHEGGWSATRQGTRYLSFGVPVELIYGQQEAKRFIEITKEAGKILWC